MNPFVVTLLKELAKTAIPIVVSEIFQRLNSPSSGGCSSTLELGPSSSGYSNQFSQYDLNFIKDSLSQEDLFQGLRDLINNGFSYDLTDRNGSRSITITKGDRRLVINK